MRKDRLLLVPVIVSLAVIAACSVRPDMAADSSSAGFAASPPAISGTSLLDHIKILASDDFEGRAPGTSGEDLTVEYIRAQFIKMGLSPGNPDGSYFQNVPMVGETSKPAFSYDVGGKSTALNFPGDFVAWSYRSEREVKIDKSEIVFVGYGVVAPEYGWDDYKGADLRGKTLLMLINDPPVQDPNNPGMLDTNVFGGKAMTYYGRWTYKYEIAAKLGAAAAIIVHETIPAAYPYQVVVNSNSHENFNLKTGAAEHPGFPAVPGWIQRDRAAELLRASGHDFDTLKKAALSKNFKPVSLGVDASIRVKNVGRQVNSKNVVARIEGSDPKLKDEYIVYSAHWDHLGMDEKLPGRKSQQVFHGAIDNASGVAALLELAKAFKAMPQPPRRTIVFVATTAEERGLLGAQYYARNPLYPLERTLVNLNIDGLVLWGRTNNVEIIGHGKSTVDDIVAKVASRQGRTVSAESRPELGSFYRADQFEFAKEGVPVLYFKSGGYIGKPPGYARDTVDRFIAQDYHKVTDDVRADWDFSGAIEDVQLLFLIGREIAQGSAYPEWKAGAEFKAKREETMRKARP